MEKKKVSVDFEPFKPINASLYRCDNKFHTEPLYELLESDNKFGFIFMDGNGTLFGTLSGGNTTDVLHKYTLDLGTEERDSYVIKTAELATQFFINTATSQTNVSGLILAAASDEFKTELSQTDKFDPRLEAKILNNMVDVSYGGEDGFSQAIELSSETRGNVKFIQEQRLVRKFTGKYEYGIDYTLECLEMGAVETRIVWENLRHNRYVLNNSTIGDC